MDNIFYYTQLESFNWQTSIPNKITVNNTYETEFNLYYTDSAHKDSNIYKYETLTFKLFVDGVHT